MGESRTTHVAAIVALTACGRVNFDARDAGEGGGDIGDGGDAASLVEPAGLIAHWKLDETSGTTANDSVGMENGMLFAGTGALPSWTTGHIAGGIQFAGDGDYIDMGISSVLNNLPAFTVMAWVRPSAFDMVSPHNCIVDKTNATAGWSFATTDISPGDVTFSVQYSGTALRRESVAGQLVIGQWSHAVATWDGTSAFDGARLYVDGIETAYANGTNPTGARLDDSAGGFGLSCVGALAIEATLDDVRLYNRALSASEVATVYALTR